jgi:PhzF family phenazine biosynthesis protein
MERTFMQVDVFTDVPYLGNPVAVVLEAEGLSTEQMHRFASWANLSETTFVLPPTEPAADYAVRIFTPACELPFAGHPTLGTCHAWASQHGTSSQHGATVVQQCAGGLVQIRRTGPGWAFAAPPLVRSGPVDEDLVRHLAEVLGIERSDIVDVAWADNGPGWIAVVLDDAAAVLGLRPGPLGDLYVGVAGPHPPGSPFAYEVRAFFPKGGTTAEDPVTGSFNASLAQWLVGKGDARPPYVVSQGKALGHAGAVHIERDGDGTIWVGGTTTTCITGRVGI